MTKTSKSLLLTLIIAICLIACSCLVVACDPETPQNDSVAYTVTILKDANTPAEGVTVQIRKGGNILGESQNTDAQGKVTFNLAPDSYEVRLTNLPEGYNADNADLSLTAENHDLTVPLEKNFAYTVKLVDKSGAPFYAQGVSVIICTIPENGEGNCLAPVSLGQDGIATIEAEPGKYHVKIEGLSSNAKYECDDNGYYTGKDFSATETEMTITVTTFEIISVTDSTPMTDEEKTAFAAKSSYTADPEIKAYHFNKNLKAGEAAYYSITAEFDGEYRIYYINGNASNYLYSETFEGDNQGRGLYSVISVLKAGRTCFVTVLNNGDSAADFEFVIESPAASYSQINAVGGVDVAIAKAGTHAIIEFTPAIGAAFKLSAPTNVKASIVQLIGASATPDPNATYSLGAECAVRFTEDMIGGPLFFAVSVADVSSYPVTFNVTVEKTADLKNTTTSKHAETELSQFGAQQGALTYVPMDGTANIVKGDDGLYRLGENGPIVVVKITSELASNRFSTFEGGCLAYIDKADGGRYRLIIDITADKTSLTKGNSYDDYRLMIRGFGDYKQVPSATGFDLVIPSASEITEEHYYVKYVNNDGVYPLTDELKTFLEAFAAAYSNNIGQSATDGNEWLFACCYYKTENPDPTPGDKDAIIGEYESSDGYSLVVNADSTYAITLTTPRGTEEIESGTWSKASEVTYKFTWTDVNATYDITFNAANGTITWVDTEMDNSEPYGIFSVAEASNQQE